MSAVTSMSAPPVGPGAQRRRRASPALLIVWATSRVLVLGVAALLVDSGVLFHDPAIIWSWANESPVDGEVPTLDEYPGPIRLVLSSAALTPSIAAFVGFWVVACLIADALVLALLNREAARVAWYWVAVGAALGPLVWLRFDLVTGVLVLLAVLLRDRRPALSGAVVAAAVLVKLWPLALLPVLLIGPSRVRWLLGVAATLTAGVVVDWVAYGAGSLTTPWTYQSDRGIQVESFWATPWLWAGASGTSDVTWEYAFRSAQLTVDKPTWMSAVGLLVAVAAGLGAAYALSRSRRRPDVRPAAVAAVTLSVVCVNTVFSPQYVLWFAPVVLLAVARMGLRWHVPATVVGIAGATQAIWPWFYPYLLEFELWAVALMSGRNAMVLLLTLLVWLALVRGSVTPQPGRTAPITGIE